MTQVENLKKVLLELEEGKDYDKCLGIVKELMYMVVDQNALYRAVDRAIALHCGKEVCAKIYRDAIKEKQNGDEHTKSEYEFMRSLYSEDDGV